ncbi:MAG: sigma-70 family RNA polymerase sigma factor [Verrucomicrobiota bacterium]|jgi:RNA polymerase sigma-70 factor (ECF subfamily)|nr:sigma-70 family RNA polymerase sigma factor [Verrucomicrobiota bacterium]MEC7639098.1 sigma-70 family RNA polymerase sigma factor [Verrucomicrobiota bacterium]MEC7857586.1 sigma-70 family RNA polymerase sigma factor [Verrucomicrobiota bacterium]MEC8659811.1 sigma-70 family RNA polymerase sigma factor [Verrucomicrobiota bacterium]MEC8691907.1 sigma-70 family RNA polymerase sigma factor [Verrucomicrobiota bacterium]|tara:strand:- start:1201 stop:1725 length:525 start_codon:yes stop_codon:yes gene_type:complete
MDQTAEYVRLWTQYHRDVERYVFSMLPRPADASEVVQEVSVRLWEKWDSYDQDRPFLPWAMRFAYLQVLKWRQGKAREKLIFSDDLLSQINATNDYEEPLMEARRKTLTLCLEKLNKDDRRIVELRYGRHGAIKEEAKKTGVKMHKLYYALERIRIQLLNCIELNLQRSGLNDV